MSQTVIGIFDSTRDAQEAVRRLSEIGFTDERVDISSRGGDNYNANNDDDDDHDTGSGISNFFSSLFGNDDDDARKYSEVGKRGSIVTVHARSSEEAERAAEILDNTGAIDVDERAEQYRSNTYSDTDRTSANTGTSIPVIEEELQVGKRVVETGGARLRSRIVEKPVEESIRLRSERVNVERNAVNRPATEADFANFKEGTVELTESKEVPIVNKEARVVEEVRLDKDVEEREETVRDTVRRTDVDVENVDKTDKYTNTSSDSDTRSDNDYRANRSVDNDDDSIL